MSKGVSVIARERLEQDRSEHAKLYILALAARIQNMKQLKAILGSYLWCILGASWELFDIVLVVWWSPGSLWGMAWTFL